MIIIYLRTLLLESELNDPKFTRQSAERDPLNASSIFTQMST